METPLPEKTERFMSLVLKGQGRLYQYIRTLMPREHSVEDVMQETLLILWRKFDQFEAGTNFDAWAAKIAYYEVLKERGRLGRLLQVFDDDVLERIAVEAAEQPVRFEAVRVILEECLAKLKPDDRALIEGRYMPGVKMTELAETLGRPANSVYKSLGRIRQQLLACMTAGLQDEDYRNRVS